jgi:hypothetical protein
MNARKRQQSRQVGQTAEEMDLDPKFPQGPLAQGQFERIGAHRELLTLDRLDPRLRQLGLDPQPDSFQGSDPFFGSRATAVDRRRACDLTGGRH